MKHKVLIVAGDPIRDIYIETEGKQTKSYEERDGGAYNVHRNAASILGNYQTFFLPSFMNLNSIYKIVRLNSKSEIHLCENANKKSYYKQSLSHRSIGCIEYRFTEDSGLILSDYNKGVLNKKEILIPSDFKPMRFIVADTKYRSLNLNYLKLAKETFWRCTGKEYDKNFASNFNYTIWTNAKNPIIVLDQKQEIQFIVDFESIEDSLAIDTCGAGDTFTAAFSSYLFKSLTINLASIREAIFFSLSCCQEVVQIDKTAITTKKIYEFQKRLKLVR
jgi:bifunctional ADP-heptose synthase (sugar kinase/adenylyltransferase)